MTRIDPVALTAELIRCPSVTPEDGGALDHLQALLETHMVLTVPAFQGGRLITFLHAGGIVKTVGALALMATLMLYL